MGNCLVLQDNIVRVMKPDGKILEYKSPIKVHQVLSEFSHHAIADKLPVTKHMMPNADLAGARLYYLLPLPEKPRKNNGNKKRVRFSDDVKGGSNGQGRGAATAGVVRIKVLISKQELQAMLGREGAPAESCVDPRDAVIEKGWAVPLGGVAEVN